MANTAQQPVTGTQVPTIRRPSPVVVNRTLDEAVTQLNHGLVNPINIAMRVGGFAAAGYGVNALRDRDRVHGAKVGAGIGALLHLGGYALGRASVAVLRAVAASEGRR